MTWLTWRQFRVQAAMVFAVLAGLAAVLARTGPGLADEYAAGIAGCTAQGDCAAFTRVFFEDHQGVMVGLAAVVLFLPALLGLFWGAPLVTRELEAGTHRLVWNQTVSRTRWLAVKLGIVGVAAMVAAGLASLAVGWWSSPLDRVAGGQLPRLSPVIFDARGIAPVGYAAFAFALGIAVGLLVRRTLPAMAVTLAAYLVVQFVVPLWIRPHLMTPVTTTSAITADTFDGFSLREDRIVVSTEVSDPTAWILANRTVDASGRVVDGLPVSLASGACAPPAGPMVRVRPETRVRSRGEVAPFRAECFAEIARLGYRQEVVYHPGSRFWALQWRETAIFGGLALGLTGFCFWCIRRLS